MNENLRAERILQLCKKGAADVQAKRLTRARSLLSLVKTLQHPPFKTLSTEQLEALNAAVLAFESSIPGEE